VVTEGEEADDALGIAQTQLGPLESVIITQDKDLDMIPGLKYNFVEDETYSVTPEQGHYNFCMQLLTGDATDNIPGLPRIGKAKAKAALEGIETEDLMAAVMQMYQAHAPTEDWYEYLREQGKLLWIRQEPGQDWEPPEIPAEMEISDVSMY
jgi:DNA polymerase-1